jgi:hypothetical protein
MILKFQRKYKYAFEGIRVVTFFPGNEWDVDENGPDADAVKNILERGDAIEVKPDTNIETKAEEATITVIPTRKSRNARL